MHRLPPPSQGTWMVVVLAQGEPMEIADLVDSRHDKVMQSIERLAGRGVIALPPLGDGPTPSGQLAKVYVFEGEHGSQTNP